jgi:WD40 repeat protein
MLVCVSGEHKLSLWSTKTGRRLSVLDFEVEHHTPQFSPDGRYLFLVLRTSRWSLWDLTNRCLIPPPRDRADFRGFTPLGEVIIFDHDGYVQWWNPRTGSLRTPSPRRVYSIGRATVSPDGRTLASEDPNTRKIQLRSAETLELRRELDGDPVGNDGLAFNPDGKTFASAGYSGTVKLWDIATGEELLTLEGFSGTVCQLRFSHDGKALAALNLTRDGSEVLLWRTSETEPPASGPGQAVSPAR